MRKNVITEIFAEYDRFKNNIEISIDKMLSEITPYRDKIVLYGAGSAGIAFLYYLRSIGIEPAYFSDGNSAKCGIFCEGLEIIDYNAIPNRVGADALVIVTINTDGKKYCKSFEEELRAGGHMGVHKKLHDAGCKNVVDYTYFRRVRKLFSGDRFNLPSCSDVYLMEEHIDDIATTYEWLSDEISKSVYADIVRFRLIDDSLQIRTEPQENQYFEYSFFDRKEDEIFVDCGAYNGISLKTFLQLNENRFKKYYGIEPDNHNFAQLVNCVNELDESVKNRIKLINAAAYADSNGAKLYRLNGPGSFISDIGESDVSTVKIDDIVDGDKVSFIKMNIEGSELEALSGAEKTVSTVHPRMAIAGYHKTRDLWEVPKKIKSFDKNYNLGLRSYMNNLSFVYYAW